VEERQLREVEPIYEWQRHAISRQSCFGVKFLAEGAFWIRDTWKGWSTRLAASKLLDSRFRILAWAKEMDITAPIVVSKPEEDEDREATANEGYDTMPELTDVSESDDENDGPSSSDSDSSEIFSEDEELRIARDDPLNKALRRHLRNARLAYRSSVAPMGNEYPSGSSDNEGTETSARSRPSVRCCQIQPGTTRSKPRGRVPKSKEKFWEALEDNSAIPKDNKRKIPHPVILTVYVNGKACRALLDSGAFADFMSTTLVDNLGLKRKVLPQAIDLQMAVQGSRSKINANATVEFEYATIKCEKTFDIINIASYDMILGTPFFWQHRILCGINPTRIAIGSNEPLSIEGDEVHTIMGAMAQDAEDKENIDSVSEKRNAEDGANSPNPGIEPKRGRGRPRKPVPEDAREPVGILPVEKVSVAVRKGRVWYGERMILLNGTGGGYNEQEKN
jgi:Retroviral aspartyl protease